MTQSNTCHICGGTYVPVRERWKCEYCGAFAPISINNEISTLLSVANQSLRNGDFDGAYDKFNDIATRNQSVSDAFWGLACAEYGIKLEDDYNGKKVPTCYNASYESLYDNPNFKKALSLADPEQKEYYNSIAKVIEGTRKEWVEKASKEKPYDIFLSYKSTDEGKSTEDEQDVYELYNFLQGKGYRVFFSHVSLKDKTGERYEPYIFNALNTAKVMIVYGSKIEYFNATWVRNEWKRFLKRISNKEKQSDSLIVVYKDLNPGRLPKPLDKIQNLDRNALDFMNQLLMKIESIIQRSSKKSHKIQKTEIGEIKTSTSNNTNTFKKRTLKSNGTSRNDEKVTINVSKRTIGKFEVQKITPNDERKLSVAESYLKQNKAKNYKDALKLYLEVLENDEHNPRALVGKLLSENQAYDLESLCKDLSKFKNYSDFIECINYCDKSISDIILGGFATLIGDLIGKDNAKAKLVFSLCYDYDSSKSSDIYEAVIFSSTKYLTEKETDLIEMIDTSLDYLYSTSGIDWYQGDLINFIRELVELKKESFARKYIERYEKTIGRDLDSVSYSFALDTDTSSLEEAVVYTSVVDNLSSFDEIIESLNENDADSFLVEIAEDAGALLKERQYKYALRLVNYYLEIDFKSRDKCIEKLIGFCLENGNASYFPIFEAIMNSFDKGNNKKYIDLCLKIADLFIKKYEFTESMAFYDRVIEIDNKNVEAILGKWKCDCCSLTLKDSIWITKDFTAFEYLLAIDSKNKKAIANKVSEYCDYYYESIKKYHDNRPYLLSDHLFRNYEKFLSYYPEEYNQMLVQDIKKMAKLLLSHKFDRSETYSATKLKKDAKRINNVVFMHAEKYLAIASSYENDDHEIYWMLLMAKLKFSNEDSLVYAMTPIDSFIEYDNAINAAYNDKEALEKYINIKNEQEVQIKKEKRMKIFSTVVWVIAIVCTIALSFYSITTYKKKKATLEENKSEFYALIDDKKCDEAINYYSEHDNLKSDRTVKDIFAFLNARNNLTLYYQDKTFQESRLEELISEYSNKGLTLHIDYIENEPEEYGKRYSLKGYSLSETEIDIYDRTVYADAIAIYELESVKVSISINSDLSVRYYISSMMNGKEIFSSASTDSYYTANNVWNKIVVQSPQRDGYTFEGIAINGVIQKPHHAYLEYEILDEPISLEIVYTKNE